MNLDQFERGRGEKKVWGGIQVAVQGELKYRIESQTTGRMWSVERGVFSVSCVCVSSKCIEKLKFTTRNALNATPHKIKSGPPRALVLRPAT